MKKTTDSGFDMFWAAYPKRVNKVAAFREWQKLKNVSINQVIEGIERWRLSDQWQDQQFIPYPERFLKYRRWEDEIPVRSNGRQSFNGRGPGNAKDAFRETLKNFGIPN